MGRTRETPRRDDSVVCRRIAGEAILVPVRGRLADLQRIYALDAVGEFVWNRLDGMRSLDEVVGDVVEAFDVDEATARGDAEAFVRQLIDAGLAHEASRERNAIP